MAQPVFIDRPDLTGLIDPTIGTYSNPGSIPSLSDFIPLGVSDEAIPIGMNLTDPSSLISNVVPGGGFASKLATGDIAGGPFTGGDTSSGPSAFELGRTKVNKTFNIGAGAGAGLDTKTIAIIAASVIGLAVVGFLVFKIAKK